MCSASRHSTDYAEFMRSRLSVIGLSCVSVADVCVYVLYDANIFVVRVASSHYRIFLLLAARRSHRWLWLLVINLKLIYCVDRVCVCDAAEAAAVAAAAATKHPASIERAHAVVHCSFVRSFLLNFEASCRCPVQ